MTNPSGVASLGIFGCASPAALFHWEAFPEEKRFLQQLELSLGRWALPPVQPTAGRAWAELAAPRAPALCPNENCSSQGAPRWTHWNFFSFPLNYIRVPAALTLNAKRLPDFGTEVNVFETSPAWNPYPCFFEEIQFIALSWIEVNGFSVSLGCWVPAPELVAADSEQEPLPGKRRHIPWFPFAEMGAQRCC